MENATELIVIGGSWGGIQASMSFLKDLPAQYKIPIVLVLHRLRNVESNLPEIFQKRLALAVQEIEDKAPMQTGCVYMAPANYHVLIEKNKTFSLDVSDFENYSRPSIDVTLTSAADAFGGKTVGILLSGASKDGSVGLKYMREKGGTIMVQDPAEAEVETMPREALNIIPDCTVLNVAHIKDFLLSLT